MKASEATKRAIAKWQKDNTKSMTIRFMPSSMDVYEHIQKQPNKTGYILDLVRADMESQADDEE